MLKCESSLHCATPDKFTGNKEAGETADDSAPCSDQLPDFFLLRVAVP